MWLYNLETIFLFVHGRNESFFDNLIVRNRGSENF